MAEIKEPWEVTTFPVIVLNAATYNLMYIQLHEMSRVQEHIMSISEELATAGYENFLIWTAPYHQAYAIVREYRLPVPESGL